MAEKTEKATPKKLRDARKKGQVAKSQDFPSAFTFVVSVSATLFSAAYLFEQMAGYMVFIFKSVSGNIDLPNRAGGFLSQCILVILSCSLPICVITALVGLLISFLIIGPVFSTEAMKIDVKRLNPVTNLKNMFKLKTFIELLKSILKITGAVILIYTVVYDSVPEIIKTASLPVVGAAQVFSNFLFKVILRVGIFFLAIAIFDLAFQKKQFAKDMKMEKFEVKQEFKDTEGDPHIRGKRKQIAQEMAYQEGPVSARRAKAVITNPIHIAVAIGYQPEAHPAPWILTMGAGLIADQIVKNAEEANVPVMRNVNLAQTLYRKGRISDYVPEETFEALAEILQWLEKIEEKKEELPEYLK